jgi:hypothetical protein
MLGLPQGHGRPARTPQEGSGSKDGEHVVDDVQALLLIVGKNEDGRRPNQDV